MEKLRFENSLFFTVNDIAKILSIGRNSAYNLVLSEGFPAIRIGKIIRIEPESFFEWVRSNSAIKKYN